MDLFTGERFIPGIDDEKLEIEHYHRYLSVAKLAKGKVVLDAASGEGYGSSILAQQADHVHGLDIDGDTIERAKEKYAGLTNLDFRQGSIAQLPFENHSIDMVVSFETIEHVTEEIQRQYLSEIKRVLKPDGILVMSTPNKMIYSDKYNYHNEFHVKEFYRQGFLSFLKHEFKNARLYNQMFEVISIIDDEESDGVIQCFKSDKKENQDGKYFIAIASNSQLPEESIASVFMNETPEYENDLDRIIQLQNEVEERNRHLAALDEQIEENGRLIVRMQQEEQERNIHIKDLDAELATAHSEAEALRQESLQLKVEIEQLSAEKAAYCEQIGNLRNIKAEDEKEKQGLIQEIRNKEGHIKLLLESERELERYKNTGAYRGMLRRQKFVNFLLPPNSKRLFILHVMKELLRHPSQWGRVVSPKYIGNYFKYLKKDSIDEIRSRYNEIVEVSNGNVTGTSTSVELIAVDTSGGRSVGSTSNEREQAAQEATPKKIEDYELICFEKQDQPTVSIVIPVYNQFEYTYCCLKSILKNSGDVPYEIIIADDRSTDLTQQIETVVKNITVATTEKNVRFLLNCNNAAKRAKGKYILFLNNDTQVQDNWLAPLVTLIESDEKIGMVGSKLIYPDGKLQEAGGILWKDGSAWNYGHMKDPESPEYSYVKEADYISGAAIMIRASLWRKLGGFDTVFAPAYYEDTDLAFEVRNNGYKVMFQPQSVVVHFEGVSNGTDTSTGLKQYQIENQKKFYEKWKAVLTKDHFENGKNVYLAQDRGQTRKQILVVDHYVPNFDKDAGGRCTYMYLQMFISLGFKVTFIGDNFARPEPYTTILQQMGIEVLYGNYYYNNWQNWLKENLKYFDYVYLQRPHISIKYIDLVKEYGRGKIFYFAHDLHHVRMYRDYLLTGDKQALEESERWKKIEMELFDKADVGHVVGSYEQGVMQKAFPGKPIRNIPLYIYPEDPEEIEKDFSKRKDILFVGGFNHTPNVDAVTWFAKNVYPEVLKKFPDLVWHVVGSKAPDEVLALASDHIVLEGFVSDEKLAQMYRKFRMVVVPLRYGAGVKGKIVEAAYYQIPVVTTSIGGEGIDASIGSFVMEDDADKMADVIENLYMNFDSLRKMSDAGKKLTDTYYTPEAAKRILLQDMTL